MSIPSVFVDASQNFQVNEEELRLVLTSQTQLIASAVNSKETGIYTTQEFITSQIYFDTTNIRNFRYVIRKCFAIGAIASGATLATNHDISGITECVNIYGSVVTDTPDFRPIPYVSVTANANIEIRVTSTQIIIANGAASPNIVSGTVVLEYLKQ